MTQAIKRDKYKELKILIPYSLFIALFNTYKFSRVIRCSTYQRVTCPSLLFLWPQCGPVFGRQDGKPACREVATVPAPPGFFFYGTASRLARSLCTAARTVCLPTKMVRAPAGLRVRARRCTANFCFVKSNEPTLIESKSISQGLLTKFYTLFPPLSGLYGNDTSLWRRVMSGS